MNHWMCLCCPLFILFLFFTNRDQDQGGGRHQEGTSGSSGQRARSCGRALQRGRVLLYSVHHLCISFLKYRGKVYLRPAPLRLSQSRNNYGDLKKKKVLTQPVPSWKVLHRKDEVYLFVSFSSFCMFVFVIWSMFIHLLLNYIFKMPHTPKV